MMSEPKILHLADFPDAIPILAKWHHSQWGYMNPGGSVEVRITSMQQHLQKERIPTTFVALEGERVLGSASLVEEDMDTRPDLRPWLASVYVDESLRGGGIGSALVQRVTEEARKIGETQLFLFTPDRESFYARMGWTTLERVHYRGEDVVLMRLALDLDS